LHCAIKVLCENDKDLEVVARTIAFIVLNPVDKQGNDVLNESVKRAIEADDSIQADVPGKKEKKSSFPHFLPSYFLVG